MEQFHCTTCLSLKFSRAIDSIYGSFHFIVTTVFGSSLNICFRAVSIVIVVILCDTFIDFHEMLQTWRYCVENSGKEWNGKVTSGSTSQLQILSTQTFFPHQLHPGTYELLCDFGAETSNQPNFWSDRKLKTKISRGLSKDPRKLGRIKSTRLCTSLAFKELILTLAMVIDSKWLPGKWQQKPHTTDHWFVWLLGGIQKFVPS